MAHAEKPDMPGKILQEADAMVIDKVLDKYDHLITDTVVLHLKDLYYYDRYKNLADIQLIAKQARECATLVRQQAQSIREKCQRDRIALQVLVNESRAIQRTTRMETDASRALFPNAFAESKSPRNTGGK